MQAIKKLALYTIILFAIVIIAGCSGNLVCSWESDDELMERILHEVGHAQTQTIESQKP